jgi:hypothetical protein
MDLIDFYSTYFDSEYIKNNPTRYLTDVFSVGFNFNFIKDTTIYPEFYYWKNGQIKKIKSPSQQTEINGFNKVEFGPFYYMNQPDSDIIENVELIIKTKCDNIIFRKFYKVSDYRDYSFQSKYRDRHLNIKFITSSCYSLPGYTNPDISCYYKMAEIAKESNPNYIISTGDIVYLEPLNITSNFACQGAYDQLKSFEPIQDIWSNHTWVCSNDDHEFGFNDNIKNAPKIDLLRETMSLNFPIEKVSTVPNCRCSSFTSKNITWIILDDVSFRELNTEYVGIGNIKFKSILGTEQINFLLDSLGNIQKNFGSKALVFILVGKSMFSNRSDTFVYCPQERDTIFTYIKFLGLTNVCFLCGDTHQSDVSEFVVNPNTNQIIREIRNSPIGSKPRNIPNDNPYQVPGSFVGGINNFGLVSIDGIEKNYHVNYSVYTINGIVYEYEWVAK